MFGVLKFQILEENASRGVHAFADLLDTPYSTVRPFVCKLTLRGSYKYMLSTRAIPMYTRSTQTSSSANRSR